MDHAQKFKSKNCRTFFETKQCMYGSECIFRHEYRTLKNLHRHYYTPQLYKLETLNQNALRKGGLLRKYEPTTRRLRAFERIWNAEDAGKGNERLEDLSDLEAELSEIEMSPEMFTSA